MPFDCGVEAEGTRLVCTIGSGPDGFEARYLGLGLANLICALSPQRAILGGGIMRQTALFEMVRRNVQQLLNGYLQVPAALGNRVGVLGTIALAEKTVQADRPSSGRLNVFRLITYVVTRLLLMRLSFSRRAPVASLPPRLALSHP